MHVLLVGVAVFTNVELDATTLTLPERVHSQSDLTLQNPRCAITDASLEVMFADQPSESIAQSFNFQSAWNPPDKFNGIYGRSSFHKKPMDEFWFIHRVVKKIFPEIGIILRLGKRDRLRNILQIG